MAVEVGQRIGEYEILRLLGAGGMGRVYCVRNVISDRVDAMKILLPDLCAEPELAQRFTAEIRTLASFDHPNIAQLRTAFQHENQLVMIMEFVEGVTLEKKASKSALPVEEVLGYASQVLAALSYAHSRGVIHRDLKPANMMVTGHGVIKLMDFGIAKSNSELQLTRPGTTMGSVYYMSPEQVSGGNVDARSDIYSLGVTLYELLTGRRPFQADTAFSVLNAQMNTPPQPPIELNKSLPPALNNIILTALAKDPFKRFQTADAFRNALRSLGAQPAAAPEAIAAPVAAPAATPASAATPEPAFEPVAVIPSAMPPAPKGNRGLWIGMGAVAALAALIAAATILPHFLSTHATGTNTASSSAQTTMPAAQTQPAPVALDPSPSAPPQPQPPSVVNQPGTTTTPVVEKTPNPPAPTHPGKPVETSVTNSNVITNQPPPNPPPNPGPTAAELEETNDRYTQLNARAEAAKDSIDQIRRQQEAGGLGMRTDITAALSRMNTYLQSAGRSLGEHDVAAANKQLDRAEKELTTLEAFLGKS